MCAGVAHQHKVWVQFAKDMTPHAQSVLSCLLFWRKRSVTFCFRRNTSLAFYSIGVSFTAILIKNHLINTVKPDELMRLSNSVTLKTTSDFIAYKLSPSI